MIWLALVLGCVGHEMPEVPAVPDPAAWTFPSEADRARYDAVRSEVAGRFAAGRHEPVDRGGNFLTERWCDAAGCVSLGVLHYGKAPDDVFGLVLDADATADGVETRFHYVIDGRTIVGDGFTATFRSPQGEIVLGSTLDHTVGETRFVAENGDALGALLASPESFGTTAESMLALLESRVAAGLPTAQRCEYGAYEGNGVPPPCRLVPLSPAEQSEARAAFEADVAARRALLIARGPAFHERLRALVPRALVP